MFKNYLALLLALTMACPAWAIERNVASQKITVTAIDRSTGRVPVAETLDRLDRHPQEIVRHLAGPRRSRGRVSGGRQTLDTGAAR